MNGQPNLFLIGAMRSGTTTLHLMLDQHPLISMSARKEPMFYVAEEMRRRRAALSTASPTLERELADFVARGRHRERASYAPLFQADAVRYLGESSHYLYWPQTAAVIRDDCASARILVALRNPVDRLFSEYQYYRRTAQVTSTFTEFARHGCRFDDDGRLITLGPESRIAKGFYGQLVAPWLDTFGAAQVRFILFEELRRDPVRTVQAVFTWLGVDPTFTPTAVRAQQGGIPVSRRLVGLMDFGGPLKRWMRRVLPGAARARMRSRLYGALLRTPPADVDTRAFLREVYRDDITALESSTGLDLRAWRQAERDTPR